MGKNSVAKTTAGGNVVVAMAADCTSEDEEPTAGKYRNGNWPTVSKDSLVARPGSTFQMAKMNQRKKKRRCKGVARSVLECILVALCIFLLLALLAALLTWAISTNGFRNVFVKKEAQPGYDARWPAGTCTTAECARIATLFADNMNKNVDPCDDFYEFACGGFAEIHDVPDDKPFLNRVGEADAKVSKRLRKIMEEPYNDTASGDPEFLAKVLYRSCVNEEALEKVKFDALQQIIKDELGGWPVLSAAKHTGSDWRKVASKLLKNYGGYYLLEITIGVHPKNTTYNVIKVDQPELGLNSRMFSLNASDSLLKTYRNLSIDVALAMGANEKKARVELEEMLQFETQLAGLIIPDDFRRDATRMYNPMNVSHVTSMTPYLKFDEILRNIYPAEDGFSVTDDQIVIVLEKEYVAKLDGLLQNTSSKTILNYLIWRFVKDHLILLPSHIRDLARELRSLQYGVSSIPQRVDECVQLTRAILPMIVGNLYVRRYFDPDQRHEVETICRNLKNAFISELKLLDWMDDITRQHAISKAHTLKHKVAYPERVLNYSWLMENFHGVVLSPKALMKNVLELKTRTQRESLYKVRNRVDPQHWFESPTTVDAYYVPTRNEMVFPAGILQFPFFNRGAPAYVNYAMIGTVVSHEITHGFDDEGRRYDTGGNLQDWWDKTTALQFENKSSALEAQYSSIYVPEAKRKLDGRLTLGENIADNGGVKTAFEAYRNWLENSGAKSDPALPGLHNFTNLQLFFISYANNWCTLMRPEAYNFYISNDEHSPPRYRTIVPLRNMPQFSQAFNCEIGRKMNPREKCIIW